MTRHLTVVHIDGVRRSLEIRVDPVEDESRSTGRARIPKHQTTSRGGPDDTKDDVVVGAWGHVSFDDEVVAAGESPSDTDPP